MMAKISEDFQIVWRSYRESTFANVKLSFRNKKDDLRVLEIPKKCNGLCWLLTHVD